MSVFFYHIALSIFLLSFVIAFLDQKDYIKNIFLPAIFGVIFGFLCFGAFDIAHTTDNAKIFFDILCVSALISLFLKIKNNYFIKSCVFLLGTSYGYEYKFISLNFNIFASDLLDSVSLSNFFMVNFGIIICICAYFLLKFILKNIKNKVKFAFFIFIIFVLIIARLAFLGLSFMQFGIILSYSNLLSIIAKIIYLNGFLPIILAFVLIVLALICLLNLPKQISRDDIIKFRTIKSFRNNAFLSSFYSVLLGGIVIFMVLFYILISSKPPQIDDPQILEPINNEFKFDAKIVLDNKLHRFAYITDDGHKIRFFLLNRFADKFAPVAVFDACSICGDMGYVKKGDELICISCNVRIFLPSVGKVGGCNPIPLEYKFDGQNITISLEEIQKGAVFFSEIVEKQVIDPVSGKTITNNSKFSYLYYGKTYFFENAQNQAKFEADPIKFTTKKEEK